MRQISGLLFILILFQLGCQPLMHSIRPIVTPREKMDVITSTQTKEELTPPSTSQAEIPPVPKTTDDLELSQIVRVGLKVNVPKSRVECAGPILIEDLNGHIYKEVSSGTYTLSAKGNKISIGGYTTASPIRLRAKNPRTHLISNKTQVRRTLKVIVNQPSKVTVINEVTIDEYLKGVLPREIISTWPEEALKAQAVASRTYLISHLNQYGSQGFDICADIHCQVYGGMTAEKKSTSKAVEATRGEILTYNGKPISTYFHASNGGKTEEVGAVWGYTNQPYLPAKPDPYGREAPWYEWTRDFTESEILKGLRKKDLVKGSRLKAIKIKKKSKSGRAEKVTVVTNKGRYTMLGNTFRIALNPGKMRSTLWTKVAKTNKGYRFSGTGWGHGVGMSQWGAKGLSDKNKTYKEILEYYYPHTALKTWKRPS